MLAIAGVTFASTPPPTRPMSSSSDRIAFTQPPKPIEDFELIDQDGRPFAFSQLKGQPALLFFGFTHCPDVCPATLAKLALLADSGDRKEDHTALVMISIDGDRDDPAAMKDYLARVSPRCLGLTGDPRTVRRIAAQFSAVFFKGLPDAPGGPYLVEHTSQIYLVDGQGRLRASFFDAPIDAIRRTVASVAHESKASITPAP